ncbi:hypothetical protein TB2_045143 [Malus domestica]
MNPSSKSQIPQLDTTFHSKCNGAAIQPDIPPPQIYVPPKNFVELTGSEIPNKDCIPERQIPELAAEKYIVSEAVSENASVESSQ